MQQVKVVLKNRTGLHARPAGMFVQEVSRYSSEIKLIKDGTEYNGNSLISILSMAAGKGEEIIIQAEGEDEAEVLESLKELIEKNFEV